MANQYFNLSYDPVKQGFDNSTWRTVYGDVAVVGGKLELDKAAIIHYGDILRGDAVFSINIAAPIAGDHTYFGFNQYSKGVHAWFKIHDTLLYAETSDGTTTYSVAIPWEAAWTNTDTEFRIQWETGLVSFYIKGVKKASISYSAPLDIPVSIVPNDPMSLYLESDALDLFNLNYIIVKSIQSYLMSEGNDNSSFEEIVKESDKITISEVITMSINNPGVNKAETITISENIAKTVSVPGKSGLFESSTVSEVLSLSQVSFTSPVDSTTVSEDLTVDPPTL